MKKDESSEPMYHQSPAQELVGRLQKWGFDVTETVVGSGRIIEFGARVPFKPSRKDRLEWSWGRFRLTLLLFKINTCEETLRLLQSLSEKIDWEKHTKVTQFFENRIDEDIIRLITLDKSLIHHKFIQKRISIWKSLNQKERLTDRKKALQKENANKEAFFPHILVHIAFRTMTIKYGFLRKDALVRLSSYLGLRLSTTDRRLFLPYNRYVSPFRRGRMPKGLKYNDEEILVRFNVLTRDHKKMQAYEILARETGSSITKIRSVISKAKHRPKKRTGYRKYKKVYDEWDKEYKKLQESWDEINQLYEATRDPKKKRLYDEKKRKVGLALRELLSKKPVFQKESLDLSF